MTQPVSQPSDSRALSGIEYRTRQLARRPPLARPGVAIYAIEVLEVDVPVVVGDKKFEWPIPEDLDGAALLKVEGAVTTVGGGSTEVQLHLLDEDGVSQGDMLTEKIIIEAGEFNSKASATQPEVDAGNDAVVWGDHIRVDVDAAGAGALGLHVICYFVPLATKTLAIEGAQGPAGGVTTWTGAWQPATAYTVGQAVSNNGSSYVAIQDHTSDTDDDEPGVGANWELYWMELSGGARYSAFEVQLFGNGYPIDTGLKAALHVPFDCTIVEGTLLADAVGSTVIDIWKDTYGNYPPTDADSITAAAPLTLSSALKTTDTSLVGWTTALAQGDVLAFNVDSLSSIRRLTISLRVERTT